MDTVNFKRLGADLPVEPLVKALAAQPQLFEDFPSNIRNTFPGSPHQDTHSVLLRWCYPFNEHTAFNDLTAVDYPAAQYLHREVGLLIKWLLTELSVEAGMLGRVMINRLLPGGRITPHTDEGSYAAHFERFHICLQGDGKAAFQCGSESVAMLSGEAWWFDHREKHAVVNNSDQVRTHLIVDVYVPEYREPMRLAS